MTTVGEDGAAAVLRLFAEAVPPNENEARATVACFVAEESDGEYNTAETISDGTRKAAVAAQRVLLLIFLSFGILTHPF
jgi:hypothetical protein